MNKHKIECMIITPTGTKIENLIKKPTLKQLQTWVGGYIEEVKLDHKRSMIVNEDGISKKLPFNNWATLLAQSILKRNINIFGNVVVLPTLALY